MQFWPRAPTTNAAEAAANVVLRMTIRRADGQVCPFKLTSYPTLQTFILHTWISPSLESNFCGREVQLGVRELGLGPGGGSWWMHSVSGRDSWSVFITIRTGGK